MAAVEDLKIPLELAELAEELRRKSLLGNSSRLPLMNQLWQTFLPLLMPRFSAITPLAEALSNALYHLCLGPSARPEEWLLRLNRGLPDCQQPQTLLDLAEVCAWLAGQPERRERALEILQTLPDALLESVFLSSWSASALRAGLQASAWWHPEGLKQTPAAWDPNRAVVHVMGGFRGWGGPFLFPPHLYLAAEQIWVQSGNEVWQILADVFGWKLKRSKYLPGHAVPAQALSDPDHPASGLFLAEGNGFQVLASLNSFKLQLLAPIHR